MAHISSQARGIHFLLYLWMSTYKVVENTKQDEALALSSQRPFSISYYTYAWLQNLLAKVFFSEMDSFKSE